MSTTEIGDLIGRILATAFLAIACAGGIWAVAEFLVFLVRSRKHKK